MKTNDVQPKHGMIIEKDVEIQMRDRMRLSIQPRVGAAPYTRYSTDYNTGSNTIHTGVDTASYILLPIIPPKSRKK